MRRSEEMNQRKIFKTVLIGLFCFVSAVFVLEIVRAVVVPALRNEMKETSQAGIALSSGYLQETLPDHVVVYTHILTNTGTSTDTFSLIATSSQNWTVALFDKSHPLITPLLPLQLEPRVTATIGLSVTVPAIVLSGTVAHTTITATSLTSGSVQSSVTDITLVHRSPGVALSSGQSKAGVPGSMVTFTHVITNTGPITDVFVLESKSQRGWAVELLDGVYQTRTLQMPLRLRELGSASFVVSVMVPDYIPGSTIEYGVVEHIVVTATSLLSDVVMSAVTDTVRVRETRTYTVLLPLVQRYEPPRVKLGVDFNVIVTDPDLVEHDFPLAQAMGADWVRVLLPWSGVEVSPGQYNWDEYDVVFDRLGELGLGALVVVYGAPEWAAEESCGPISDTLALENFLNLAVPRYAGVAGAWEFINEPDGRVPHEYGPVIGCWGLYPAEYVQQLGIFYSKIKVLDPDALVFFGGLAYDGWTHFERSFFEQTLQNGASSFFDGVSLHYYPINFAEFPTMAHKVNEIRDTMARNGVYVYGKKIWVTETGMWVNDIGHEGLNGSLELQRDFIVRELIRGFGAGVDNIFWFDVREYSVEEGKVHRWLISANHEPINGYNTFQHFAGKLEDASYAGLYQGVPADVEAHQFTAPGRSLYILWSNAVTHTVTIPAPTDAILTNRDGDESTVLPVHAGAVEFQVGTKPMFVEITTGY